MAEGSDHQDKVGVPFEKLKEGDDATTEEELIAKMTRLLKERGYRVVAPGNVVARERASTSETPFPPQYRLPTPQWNTPSKSPAMEADRNSHPLASTPENHGPVGSQEHSRMGIFQSAPKLSTFSGKVNKGEVDFDIWSNEVKCLLRDPHYDVHTIGQAIRRSLRGEAAHIALHLGEEATPIDIMSKLISVFGSVLSEQQIMQTFYLANQQDSESIASWACRLEDLVFQAQSRKYISKERGDQMLIQKFWSGLHSEKVKSATRHKLETFSSFDSIVTEVRLVEQEMLLKKKSNTTVKQHQQQTTSCTDFNSLAQQLITRMAKLEASVNTTSKEASDPIQQLLHRMDKLEAKLQPDSQSTKSSDKSLKSQPVRKTWTCFRCGQEGHIAVGCKRTKLNENGQLPGGKQ